MVSRHLGFTLRSPQQEIGHVTVRIGRAAQTVEAGTLEVRMLENLGKPYGQAYVVYDGARRVGVVLQQRTPRRALRWHGVHNPDFGAARYVSAPMTSRRKALEALRDHLENGGAAQEERCARGEHPTWAVEERTSFIEGRPGPLGCTICGRRVPRTANTDRRAS